MVLKMSRPTRHKVTGIYQFRQRVPKHLIPLVGKKEEKASLGTRDPQEAKIAHARMLAVTEARWRQLSAGTISLSQKQAVAMSGEIYRSMIAASEDDPGSPHLREAGLVGDYLHLRPEKVKIVRLSKDDALVEQVLETYRTRRNDRAINEYLKRHGYQLDEPSVELLRKAVAQAVLQAKEHLLRMANGDYRPDPDADRFPKLDLASKKQGASDLGKYALMQVFEDYVREKQIAESSQKKWRGIIAKVAAEVPDIRDLTGDWVVGWKDRLLAKGLSAVYVRDSHLASLRATCGYAKDNRRIVANPLEGINVAVPRKTITRQKWFTSEETVTILKGSLAAPPPRTTREMANARRWVPWLCAYTGARVGEIAQLRKQDIQTHDGYLLISITPEAGSTKDRNPRFVAVHPHLLEQGFADFVRARRPGPLFYDPSKYRGGKAGNAQYNKVSERLAEWVRELGVDDPRIRPNHAWRHLFKTEARGVFMDVGARDYMQGHVPATEGEAYGGYKPRVLAHEIAKLPRFELE
ncbi:UNVERIFIED_ORG: integrase [Rhizobium esperanzae]